MQAVRSTRRQCTHVAAVLVGSALARAQGVHWGGLLAESAAAVLSILGILLFFRLQDRRDAVINLILAGDDHTEIPIVRRERDQLLSARNRSQLARSIVQVAEEATALPCRRVRLTPPLFTRRIVAPVASELSSVRDLLAERTCRPAAPPAQSGDSAFS